MVILTLWLKTPEYFIQLCLSVLILGEGEGFIWSFLFLQNHSPFFPYEILLQVFTVKCPTQNDTKMTFFGSK